MSKTQNNNWYMWLPVLALAAIPFGCSVELLVLIMALLGLNDLFRSQNKTRQNEVFKLFFSLSVEYGRRKLALLNRVGIDND